MNDLLVAAIVAAVVSAVVAFLMKPKTAGTAEGFKFFDVASALIVLYEESGVPRAKVFPYRLQAKKDWDVEWIILDPMGLSAADEVKIDWTSDDPLKEKVHGKKRIKSKVKKDSGTYTYQVLLGTTVLADPDLEIVF